MDNLTHTLVGLIAGESLAHSGLPQSGRLSPQVRRVFLITLTTVASNLPDLDLLVSYQGFTRSKLDYMLAHRGYTHTMLGCVVLAAALYGLAELWMHWRKLSPTPRERSVLAAATLLGTALHLSMDALNSYGVHPFWPLENRWYYGDSVFIVEPLYWVCAAPLLFVQRSIGARAFVALAITAAVVLSALSGLVPLPLVIGLAALAAALLAFGRQASSPASTLASLAGVVAVTAGFLISGQVAAREARSVAGTGQLLDHVLTPMPVNPLCWDLLLLEQENGIYRTRHALMSIAPGVVRAAQCPRRVSEASATTARFTPVAGADSASIHWLGELEIPVDELAMLAANDCTAAALLRFARAPFTASMAGARVIGDLRFDREPELGFAELPLSGGNVPHGGCKPAAPWTPPRAQLLNR